eukprot:2487040-Pyramimonas_sp.AAC.1
MITQWSVTPLHLPALCGFESSGGAVLSARGDLGASLVSAGGDGDERKDTFKRQVRRREGRQPAPKSCAGAGANNKSLRALAMN